jgi:hypothetical protein
MANTWLANFLIEISARHLALLVVDHGVTVMLSRRTRELRESGLMQLREVVGLLEQWIKSFKSKETAVLRGQRLDEMIDAAITMHKSNYAQMSYHTLIGILVAQFHPSRIEPRVSQKVLMMYRQMRY